MSRDCYLLMALLIVIITMFTVSAQTVQGASAKGQDDKLIAAGATCIPVTSSSMLQNLQVAKRTDRSLNEDGESSNVTLQAILANDMNTSEVSGNTAKSNVATNQFLAGTLALYLCNLCDSVCDRSRASLSLCAPDHPQRSMS